MQLEMCDMSEVSCLVDKGTTLEMNDFQNTQCYAFLTPYKAAVCSDTSMQYMLHIDRPQESAAVHCGPREDLGLVLASESLQNATGLQLAIAIDIAIYRTL